MVNERAGRRVEVTAGDRVGKFRVERILGRGGMGVVVEATNEQLDQRVALKLLAPGDDAPEALEAVVNEARTAARLRSDHVVRVYDVGLDPVHGPYIVMELLNGSTLAEVIADLQRVSVQRAAEHAIDACEGLAEAAVRGIVHQDIKPGNLFLAIGNDGKPVVKVLDFGIAKIKLGSVFESSPSSEPDGKVNSSRASALGTPFYLAPEQLRAEPDVDHRADIWALGCVLFELVTGEKAFFAGRFSELVVKVLECKRTPVPADVDVPAGFLEIIDRCLEKSAAKRFATVGELALALLPFARRRAHSVTARAVARVRDAGLDPYLTMPSSMPPRPSDVGVDLVSSQSIHAPPLPVIVEAPPAAPQRRPLLPFALAALFGVVAVLAFFTMRAVPLTGRGAVPSPTTLPPPVVRTEPAELKAPHPVETQLPVRVAPPAITGDASVAPLAAPQAAPGPPPAVSSPSPPHSAASHAPADSEIRTTR